MNQQELKRRFHLVMGGEDQQMVVLRQRPFLFVAVNDNEHASLLARVSLSPSQVFQDGKGFTVSTVRNTDRDYVKLTATGNGAPPLFLMLVEHILNNVSVEASEVDGADQLISAMDEFRRFSDRQAGRLSRLEVRGLFAELVFLSALLDAGMSLEDAIGAWRGPWSLVGSGTHDFTFTSGRGVEVKSTSQPPLTVRVSSDNQLLPGPGELDLVVLPLEAGKAEGGEAVSFREFARSLGERIGYGGGDVFERWTLSLKSVGLDLDDEWYDRHWFVPGVWHRYAVAEGFPHLDPEGIPSGIRDVRYSLELPKLASYARPFADLIKEVSENE